MTEQTVTAKKALLRCQFCQSWNSVDASRAQDRPKCGKCGKPMLLDRPVKLDDESFARTISNTEIPVVVDFYADWCGPCRMMAPAVDELAGNFTGRIIVAKLDTDASQKTSMAYGIRGIPTVIVFHGGKEVARQSGALPYSTLAALVTRAAGT